jgi:hypothetical protein
LTGSPIASGAHTFTVQATDSTGGSTTQSFTLTVSPAPTAPQTTRNADGSVRLDWISEVGVSYVVDFSDNLATWVPAAPAFTATATSATWTDDGTGTGSAPSSRTRRFYRLRASR